MWNVCVFFLCSDSQALNPFLSKQMLLTHACTQRGRFNANKKDEWSSLLEDRYLDRTADHNIYNCKQTVLYTHTHTHFPSVAGRSYTQAHTGLRGQWEELAWPAWGLAEEWELCCYCGDGLTTGSRFADRRSPDHISLTQSPQPFRL